MGGGRECGKWTWKLEGIVGVKEERGIFEWEERYADVKVKL
jgi:hypothetical protein